LSDLIEAFGSPGNRPSIIVILRAYFDASYKVGDPAYVIAGYIGATKEWRRVEKLWLAAVTKWGLPSGFHLSNLEYLTGGKGRECTEDFARIIAASELYGLSAGVEAAHVERELGQFGRNAQWQVAARLLLDLTKQQVGLNVPAGQVIAIFDSDAPEGVAGVVFEAFRDQSPFAHLSLSTRKCTPLLECADLAAGLARREWYGPQFEADDLTGSMGIDRASPATRGAGAIMSAASARAVAEVMAKRRAQKVEKPS
jgi:hypothetical protein